MNNIYNVFDTLAEAIVAQESDFDQYKKNSGYDPMSDYWQQTTAYAQILQRADGKYVYSVYPQSNKVYPQEIYQEGWLFDEN